MRLPKGLLKQSDCRLRRGQTAAVCGQLAVWAACGNNIAPLLGDVPGVVSLPGVIAAHFDSFFETVSVQTL